MLSMANLLQSAFKSRFKHSCCQNGGRSVEDLCGLCNGSKHAWGRNPAMLLSIYELGDKHYKINKSKPYYIAAQIANIQVQSIGWVQSTYHPSPSTAIEICEVTRVCNVG
jgi:hypothetical protein